MTIYDIGHIVAQQLLKGQPDALYERVGNDQVLILTTGGYIHFSRRELIDGLDDFIARLTEEESG